MNWFEKNAKWPAACGLLLLMAIYVAARLYLAQNSFFQQADYDESVTGAMTLQALAGGWQPMVWGQPYTGSLEARICALVAWVLGPSTMVLRFSLALVGCLGMLGIYAMGRLAGGRVLGLFAAAFWALPPVFMGVFSLYITGGHMESITAVALVMFAAVRLAFAPGKRDWLVALGMGLAAGLGWWSSLLSTPQLAVCALFMLAARPRLFLGPIPWLALLGFLAGASPLLYFNLTHDFMTFKWLFAQRTGNLFANLPSLFMHVWLPTLVGAWWDAQSVNRSIPKPATWAVLLGVSLPAAGLAVKCVWDWVRRILAGSNPFQKPLDLAAALFFVTLAAHAASSYGSEGMTRYTAVLFVPLAVLVGAWLARAAKWRWWAAAPMLVLVLGFNLATGQLFVGQRPGKPVRPIDVAVTALKKIGVNRCYAHFRVAYPITYMSRGKVICSDFFGWRNFTWLNQMDRAPKAALVAHQKLCAPCPREMDRALAMLGGAFRRTKAGYHVFWHDFKPPTGLSPLPADGWRISTSHGAVGMPRVLADRNPDTALTRPLGPGSWLMIDLGRKTKLGRISLLPSSRKSNPGVGTMVMLALEASDDGVHWRGIKQGLSMAGLRWRARFPKLGPVPLYEISFPPTDLRYLRVVMPKEGKGPALYLSEVFLYQAGGPAHRPSVAAQKALKQALRALRVFYVVEPTGPHPGFLGVPYHFRRGLVDWPLVVGLLRRAVMSDPLWELPQRKLLEAYWLGGLGRNQVRPVWNAMVPDRLHSLGPGPGSACLLSGQGRVRVGGFWGGETVALKNGPRFLGTGRFGPKPGGRRVDALRGQVLVQPLRGGLEQGLALMAVGRDRQALAHLRKVKVDASTSAGVLLRLAALYKRSGQGGEAARLVDLLRKHHATSLAALAAAARQGGSRPAPEALRPFSLLSAWDWRWRRYDYQAERTTARFGPVLARPEARNGLVVEARQGRDKAGYLKIWLPQYFRKGRYLLSFRVRGRAPGGSLLATMSYVCHFQDKLLKEAGFTKWRGGGKSPQFQRVVVPLTVQKEPARVEARVYFHGRGTLELDEISIQPDLVAELAPDLRTLGMLP